MTTKKTFSVFVGTKDGSLKEIGKKITEKEVKKKYPTAKILRL